MEKFDLSLWLKDKNRKVVTRDGRPVTIVCPKSPYDTIVGFCGEDQYPDLWNLNGKFLKDRDSNFDLFFADEEEELTEFEKKISDLINYHHSDSVGKLKCVVKEEAKILLDLARKELQPEFDKEMDKMLAETDKVVYQKGKQDALKSLPKWKKATERKDLEKHIAILEEDKVLLSNYLDEGDYYIDLEDLKTLPKEE